MRKNKKEILWLTGLILLALIFKLLFTPQLIYKYDIYSFGAWSMGLAENTVSESYQLTMPKLLSPVNYPPAGMYIFATLGWLNKTFIQAPDWDLLATVRGTIFFCLLKVPAIIFDLLTALAAYYIFRRKFTEKLARIVFFWYLANPMAWLSSSLWGAVDAWHSFFVLLCFYFLTEKKYLLSGSMLALAALLKPQALIFFPLVGLLLLFRVGVWKTIKAVGAGLGTSIIILLPWLTTFQAHKIYQIYTGFIGYYERLSSFAFNFWYLLYGVATVNTSDQIPIFFTLTFQNIGLLLYLFFYALLAGALIWMRCKKKSYLQENFWLWSFGGSVLVALGFFLFCTEIHERYLFQAMPLALMLYYLKPWRKIYHYISWTAFANTLLCIVLTVYYQTPAENYIDVLGRGFSLFNLYLFFLILQLLVKELKRQI